MFRRRWTNFDCVRRRGKHGVAQCRHCWVKQLLIIKASAWCLEPSASPTWLWRIDWATCLYFPHLVSVFPSTLSCAVLVNYCESNVQGDGSISPSVARWAESDRCWHISSCKQFNYQSTVLTMTSLNIWPSLYLQKGAQQEKVWQPLLHTWLLGKHCFVLRGPDWNKMLHVRRNFKCYTKHHFLNRICLAFRAPPISQFRL